MLGFGPSQASRRRRTGGIVPPQSIVLNALSLAVPTLPENTVAGTVIGPILGRTGGSTLSLTVNGGGRFAITGTNLVAGPTATNFETATSHAITIRETLAGATNTPRDTVLDVAVTNLFEVPDLNPLTLSGTSYLTGAADAGTVTGATSGSTIVASGLPAGLTVNGAARTWAWSGSGSAGGSTIVLTETLADSANSPRVSNVAVTIATNPYMTLPGYTTIAVFGDSIALGINASDQTHPGTYWPSLLATNQGATLTNQAISGTVLQNSADSGGSARANNGRDRFVSALTGANLKAAVFLAYGFNDARYVAAPATFNVANYQADYREVLNGLIALGYARSDIYLGSPYYITSTGLTTGSTGFSGQTRATYETFVAAAAAVAAEYGVNYCDLYAETNNASFIADVDANDFIHPEDTGHAQIFSAWRDKTTAGTALNTRTAPTGVTPTGGVGQITASCATVGSATSYEFVPMLSWVDGATTTDSDGSGAVLSLSAGTYRVKARAVFGDGTKSPWTFAAADVTVTAADTTAPTITSANTASVAENATLSHALTANESVTWSIVGGADQARLEISGSTLRWLSNGTKDFEIPDDADSNNTYVVTVRATDTASNTTDQTITVTVTDVSEGGAITFLADDFTGTNGTNITSHSPDTGGSWVLHSGYSPTTPNRLDGNGGVYAPTPFGGYHNDVTPPSADYYVEGIIKQISVLSSMTCGVAGRMDTSANTMYFARWNQGSGWQLFKLVAGTATQLGSTYADAGFTAGVSRTCRLTMTGTTISMDIDGVTRASVTDSSISGAGKAGMRMGAGGSNGTATNGTHLMDIVAVG